MKNKTILCATLAAVALFAHGQTNNNLLVLQPGINVLATNAAHFPTVYGTNKGAGLVISGYDTADVTQFTVRTNAVDVAPIGTPFVPVVTTTLKPVITRSIPARSVARLQARDWSNGCIVVVSGAMAHAITTSLTVTNQ